MTDEYTHHPVLLPEVMEALLIKPDGIYIDTTFGRGGHTQAILQCLGPEGCLLAIDRDPEAVIAARRLFGRDHRFTIAEGAFNMLGYLAEDRGWRGKVNGIVFDLGVSSPQFDDPMRGFSFLRDGPLDMRMDPGTGVSAAQWLAEAPQDIIAKVLKEFGEERHAWRIAHAIVAARGQMPIQTTRQLADIIAAAHPSWERGKNPATRSFQAIRIFINKELEQLQTVLVQTVDVLAPGGRIVIISFHSLEDRIVKRFMRGQVRGDDFPPDLPVTHDQLHPKLRSVGRAIHPGAGEIARNPRARSAVLRVAERLRPARINPRIN